MNFLWYIIIGIVAGFLAGKIMHGGGFGLIVNLIVGIIGGLLGGWMFGLFGIRSSSPLRASRPHRHPKALGVALPEPRLVGAPA